ncbi:MAG: DUF1588 domain-containing protein [Bryobacterales bacterium]|nr:DUF1588 domain-containing protein [Bryobacterales bacterium]MDE0624310.1 DUF1588 domain-containing protein [Bryobacterales bacterium]
MPSLVRLAGLLAALAVSQSVVADQALLKTHCAACHKDVNPPGGFSIGSLGTSPNAQSIELWIKSRAYVEAGYMPPANESRLSVAERRDLVRYLDERIGAHPHTAARPNPAPPRRLNNRELANSVRDVLLIEDVGTHQPLASVLGDTLEDGFDTIGDTLGLSQFHLEQYIEAFRRVVDGTILSGSPPVARRYAVTADEMRMTSLSQTARRERANRTPESIDFLDPRLRVYFSNFEAAPATGWYRIKIRATGKDRGIYAADDTGIYGGDPIRLAVHLGDRKRVFDLPDGEAIDIEIKEWIAAGTRLELSYPTDGLRFRGNGNFKFQFSIGHDHIKQRDPELYEAVLREMLPKAPARTAKNPRHWSHWTEHWQGARPRLFRAEVEGPLYTSWPPKRQIELLGENPRAQDAAMILLPIAERAWRRQVGDRELDPIVRLVRSKASEMSDLDAIKEGIVAILASPSFLLLNLGDSGPAERLATKLGYFLESTIPDESMRKAAHMGTLDDFAGIRSLLQSRIDSSGAEEFLRQFPHSWLELDRINFMAPDPDRYPLYDRKRLSEDMVNEALRFFRHVVENNLPVTELLSADYSFINADLAKVYQVDGVPQDSTLRKHTFADGRRGGLLGMGAFLTLTADSLGTSPIHRAVYVMEKFLGIHPPQPPADVDITEPDIRQAKTIKQILAAHTEDVSCASCHASIDPYGYAFENFDPVGAWRENYTEHIAPRPSTQALLEIEEQDRRRAAEGLPALPRPWESKPIPVDASATLSGGTEYRDIIEFRRHLLGPENLERFVRCFIAKLLVYANGAEPENETEIQSILSQSAQSEHRIVDTIAAVVDSALFRE